MNIKDLILKKLKEKGEVKSSEIVKATGFSRVYVNKYFKELCEEGVLPDEAIAWSGGDCHAAT